MFVVAIMLSAYIASCLAVANKLSITLATSYSIGKDHDMKTIGAEEASYRQGQN